MKESNGNKIFEVYPTLNKYYAKKITPVLQTSIKAL